MWRKVKQQELKTSKSVEGEKVTHHLALGDGHTLIVMFDKDAKCSGIQRVRGEGDFTQGVLAELAGQTRVELQLDVVALNCTDARGRLVL